MGASPKHPPGRAGLWLTLGLAGCLPAVTNYATTPGPRFAGPPAQAPWAGEAPGLKVVTWNVKWGEQPEAAAEILATHPRLREADIVLLQEMHETAVETIAARLGSGYVYYPAMVHPRVRHHVGNAILSRWPLLEDRKVVLPHLGRIGGTARAAVVATVKVREQRIRVYSLHLATPFEIGHRGIEDQVRAVIQDAAGSPDPVLIAGDFNSSRVGGLLVDAGYEWVTQRIGRTAWIMALDHVFIRGLDLRPVAGTVVEKPIPSDHRPVWAVMQP
jgi:endonuclease/exonuclease/phosphatase (EEP) superfamily protein YafD